jgi:carboxymethylenebutenolidase
MKSYLATMLLVLPSAVAIVPALADSTHVATRDAGIRAEYVEYASPHETEPMRGYLAYPWRQNHQVVRAPAGLTGRRRPGVLVVSDKHGLNAHVEAIVQQLAADQFIAFAPDARTTKSDEAFAAAATYLKNRPECTGAIGVVGFGDGGAIANRLSAQMPDLTAVVSFDARTPTIEDIARATSADLVPPAWQRTLGLLHRSLRR